MGQLTGYMPMVLNHYPEMENDYPAGVGEISYLAIQNTSTVSGTETVQLYICDEKASMVRPVQEPAGFCRVPLVPGDEKRVVFRLDQSQFAFLDRNMKWKIEKGSFAVNLGASGEDARLTESFCITETCLRSR